MTVYTIPLHKLPLRARFLIKDGILAPEFANKGPNSLHQAIQLEWLPVAGMRIFLMVTVSNTSIISAAKGRPVTSDQHLFAMDSAGRTYRLPTSNCFENCTLCTGIHRTDGASHIDCLNGAVNQFMTSEWQHDLAERGGVCSVQNSQSLFRYKPLEPDGFEQLPPLTADWTKYCVKVSNEFITSNMVVSND